MKKIKSLAKKIRYYYRCIKWLYKNRNRSNCRQKYRAMEREVKYE